ncbi:hypothetical protein ACFQ6N_17985 [Kitasatospora sp. NPDC056446]|uniref:helix-turn-helix transcriptional regulator n=1 Tax=Kitasatospora sp. NPDC056446 TaxID=3345819 RepID=UPI0036CF4D81
MITTAHTLVLPPALGAGPTAPPISARLVVGNPCPGCQRRPRLSGVHGTVLHLLSTGWDPVEVDRAYSWWWGATSVYVRVAARCLHTESTAHAVDIAVRAGLLIPLARQAGDRLPVTAAMQATGQLIAHGHSRAEIAEIRGVGPRAVSTAVRRLRESLDAGSDAEIVLALHALALLDARHPCPCRPQADIAAETAPHRGSTAPSIQEAA